MKELFHWQGASDSTREFVTSELQMLLNATLHSIKIEPRTLNGNLIHWSAYQHYQPNLPVEGYLHIAYTPDDPSTSPPNSPESYLLEKGDILRVYIEGVLPYIQPPSASASPPRIPIEGNARLDPSIGFPIVVQENGTISLPSIAPILVRGMSVRQATKLIKKTYLDAKIFTQPERLMPVVSVIKKPTTHPKRILSLELGKIGNEFRLVNYVTLGERKLPKGLVEGLSIRGNIEPLADGTHLQTDLITNPGSLISAHLANEEIRQRGFENKKNAILLPGRGVFQQFQGKITEVENDGDIVFINLGKADALRPRVRFGVVDSSVERVADAKPKAQIEVVEVLTTSEHLSRCKVLAIRGSSTIQKGDLIYSPAWHPGKKVEFALIGKMDMDGDGEDDRETVKAMIESNGGLVTLDLPPDGKVTGELTMDTRWLVIGEDVNTLDQGGLLQAKAKWFGISRINLNKLSGWLRGSNAIVIPPK